MTQERFFEEIKSERRRQDVVFGEQNHIPSKWMSILVEEVGSAAKKANNFEAKGSEMSLRGFELEVIQVAAVAVAILECLKREKWNGKETEQEGSKRA